jgi:superfamily II DNA or RNA helicase
MNPIVIEKLNEVFLRINCNLEQALEFKEFTSCFANNYFFHPKFKSHMWNGKISFYNMRDMTLPVGLLPQFFKFCEQFDYQYEFNFDKNELFNNINDEEIDDFYKAIFKSTEFWPRDYQDESVRKALRNKRGVIVLPTASGKSLVIYCLIRFLLAQDKKILLVVPSINLTNQMFNDFADYGFDAKQYCSVLYGTSKRYDVNKPILISTWQSIVNKNDSFFTDFGAMIEDEAHGGKANSLQKVAKKCVNAEYRIGLTGTLPTSKVDNFTIFGYLGPQIYYKKAKELMDQGVLSKIKIANLIVRYPECIIEQMKNEKYNAQIDFTFRYQKRNNVIKYIIDHIDPKNNAIILCHKIEHLKSIEKFLREQYPNKKIFIVYGQTKAEEREETRQLIDTLEGAILLGSYGTMSTGVNIKKLHHVIFASSYKSKIKVLQSIGRGLRLHKDKFQLILWDIVDDMTWVKRTGNKGLNYVYEHFLLRLKYYKDQGFNYVNRMIDIEKI